MATVLEPNFVDEGELLEYALLTDAATATLAAALSLVLDRLRSRRSRVGEEDVAIRLAAQMRQTVQWRRLDRATDWNDLWVPPGSPMQ